MPQIRPGDPWGEPVMEGWGEAEGWEGWSRRLEGWKDGKWGPSGLGAGDRWRGELSVTVC